MPNNNLINVPQNRRANTLMARAAQAINLAQQYAPQVSAAIKGMKQKVNINRKAKKEKPAPKMKTMGAPVSIGNSASNIVTSRMVGSTGKSMTMKGTTVLGPVYCGAGSSALLPNLAFYASSNPLTFPDRMSVMASTYDKYVYRRAVLRFVPSVGTNTAGQIAICIDRDYADAPQAGSWAQTLSYESAASGSVWASHATAMSRDGHELRTYFTNASNDVTFHESEQFKFFCYTLGCPTSTLLGQLMLDYEIELISPVYSVNETSVIGLPMTTSQLMSIDAFATSVQMSFSASFVINSVSLGAVFEMVFQALPPTATGFTIGNGGPLWTPATSGVTYFYVRGLTYGGNKYYSIYLDYPSALAGGTNSLYNPGAVAVLSWLSGAVTYRKLSNLNVGIA